MQTANERDRGRLLLMASAICLVGLGSCASQTTYPAKPIMLVCPWSAGGGTDRIARQLAVQLEQELGVPVNVVNATGGGGVTGHTRGAVANADGYTITMATVELSVLHWRGLTDITHDDFEPILLLNRDDAAVFVRQDAAWKRLADLQKELDGGSMPLKASGTAHGGIWHIALAGWCVAQGLPADTITWISINGAGPSLQELMAGGVDLVCCSVPEAYALVKSGEVRCLGVMSQERHPLLPKVPTFSETGCDWTLGGWRGVLAPNGVSDDRLNVLRNALETIASSDEFSRFMSSGGFGLDVANSQQFADFLEDADAAFGKILSTPEFSRTEATPIGPLVFPTIIFGLSGFMLSILLWRGQLSKTNAEASPAVRQWRLLAVPTAILVFVLTVPTIGFVLAASVMLSGILLVLRVRVVASLGITGAVVPAVYQVFAVWLGVPLPWGWLGW